MKPTIRKQKNVRGRVTGHVATIGPIESSVRPTPSEAATECESLTIDALARLDRGTYIGDWHGRRYVVSPTTSGWRYWHDGLSRVDTFVDVAGDREDAIDSALHHLAQAAWTIDADDDAFCVGLPREVAKQIRTWIVFQRAYASAKKSGATDTEAHRIGCEESSRADADERRIA